MRWRVRAVSYTHLDVYKRQVHTYDDHRMAMCLSLAAFNPLAGAHCPQRILDPRCVAKTFPDLSLIHI